MGIKKEPFGQTPDGSIINRFSLCNDAGMTVGIINYGAIVQSIRTPDRRGCFGDVVLGHADLAGYLDDVNYLGALVGRYANRIAGGQLPIGDTVFALTLNNGSNHLHGGRLGFDKRVWQACPRSFPHKEEIRLTYDSPHLEEGYPGHLQTAVTYALTNRNELVVTLAAKCDRPTHVNLSQHSYFNLGPASAEPAIEQTLWINASHFTPVNPNLIPTGEIRSVEKTPFDFQNARTIVDRIDDGHRQIRIGNGYDHNWVLKEADGRLKHQATLFSPHSGRKMKVMTTEPGLQFYSGNAIQAGHPGKDGRPHVPRQAVCLETQHFPDSPHHPLFPTTLITPQKEFLSQTVFQFGVEA